MYSIIYYIDTIKIISTMPKTQITYKTYPVKSLEEEHWIIWLKIGIDLIKAWKGEICMELEYIEYGLHEVRV